MESKKIIIAIDGPAGAGKTTIAKALSKQLDILYLNTGALYRAYGLKCLDNKLNANSLETASNLSQSTVIDVKYIDGAQHTILDGVDVTDRLYDEGVSGLASTISKHDVIRQSLKNIQQKIASNQSVIMDGRDIGSVVLPMADYKFYLDADVEVRAKRRWLELKTKDDNILYEDVLREIKERDHNDITRDLSPLVKCKDAITIDCTNLGVNQVVDLFLKYIKKEI